MDFLLLVDDLTKAESILTKFSYNRTFKSENVVQFVSDLAPYGQLNIVIAFRKISRGMLERRVGKELQEDLRAYTLIPEDLIGLKLQALANDSRREDKEKADISMLLSTCRGSGMAVDWELLEGYFKLFDREDHFKQVKETYG